MEMIQFILYLCKNWWLFKCRFLNLLHLGLIKHEALTASRKGQKVGAISSLRYDQVGIQGRHIIQQLLLLRPAHAPCACEKKDESCTRWCLTPKFPFCSQVLDLLALCSILTLIDGFNNFPVHFITFHLVEAGNQF